MENAKYHFGTKETISIWGATLCLILFQWMFVGEAILESGGLTQYSAIDVYLGLYHTVEAPITAQLCCIAAAFTLFEIILAALMHRFHATAVLPIVVPAVVLLTIGFVYQTFVNSPIGACHHYRMIGMGFLAVFIGIALSRNATLMLDNHRKGALFGMLHLMTAFVVVSTIYGFFVHVNGSGAYFLGMTPGEMYKVFVLMFLSTALIDMQTDTSLLKYFMLSSLSMFASLVLLRSVGDAIILAVIVSLVVLQYYGLKHFLALLGIGSASGVFAYALLTRWKPNHYIVQRFRNVGIVATDPSANENLRRNLISVIYRGICGSGTADTGFVSGNFASETDYAFGGIASIFGAVTALLVVCGYLFLLYALRMRVNDAAKDTALYTLSNLVAALIGTQAIIHIGCNLNLFPMTGICLPLISRGGSNMICVMLSLGLAIGRKLPETFPHYAEPLAQFVFKGLSLLDAGVRTAAKQFKCVATKGEKAHEKA